MGTGTPLYGDRAPTIGQYVVIAGSALLDNERILTGTSNQIVVTDNGAGSTVVLSTPQDIHTGASPTFAGVTLTAAANISLTNTVAAGESLIDCHIIQGDDDALTGTLRGAYITASCGDEVATGTIRGIEMKARAGYPGETGANVNVLEGFSASSDAKTYDVTTHRGGEIILDGGAGTSTLAVGLRIANNFQANRATTSYALEIYRDSFDYTADIYLSSGGLIGGASGHLKMDSSGNIILAGNVTMPDGGTIGQAAGPLVTFDNTNNYLQIAGCNVGIGTLSVPDRGLEIADDGVAGFLVTSYTATQDGSTCWGQKARGSMASPTAVLAFDDLLFLGGRGYDGSTFRAGPYLLFEATENWSGSARGSRIRFITVPNTTTGAVVRMVIEQSGRVGIPGTTNAQLHVDQASTTAAIPVLFLDQGDVSEQCIQFSSDATDRDIHLFTVNVTGTPAMDWMETLDVFSLNKGLDITAGAASFNTLVLSAAGPTDNLDVSGVNTIFVDTSNNNVTLGGTIGGVDGQLLFIVIDDATNNFTIENEEGTGNQDFVLHAGADETMTAEHGGWIFVNHGGNHWHDASHAKHV